MKFLQQIIYKTVLSAGMAVGLAACGGEQTRLPAEAAVAAVTFNTQTEAGAAAYATNCAACHGANLEGTTLGPILSGQAFLLRWASQTPALLLGNIQANMPPGGNPDISAEDYLNIVAHLLGSNGVDGEIGPLTATTDFVISQNISRIANRRRAEPEPPQGVTIAGTVENFVPITDAMLANPDPGDWPMHRRDYYGHSYSPPGSDRYGKRRQHDPGVGLEHARWRLGTGSPGLRRHHLYD